MLKLNAEGVSRLSCDLIKVNSKLRVSGPSKPKDSPVFKRFCHIHIVCRLIHYRVTGGRSLSQQSLDESLGSPVRHRATWRQTAIHTHS